MKEAWDLINDCEQESDGFHSSITLGNVEKLMIEFAKLHVEKILELQHLKYYAGETGYIKKEEWEELLTNIK